MNSKLKQTLEVLMLNDVDQINQEIVKHQYLVLSKIYHPDSTKISKFKNGEKFIELSEAFEYASNNIDFINQYLEESKVKKNKSSDFYDYFGLNDTHKNTKKSNFEQKNSHANNQQNQYEKKNHIYIIPLTIAILMFIAILPMPYGYYIFLRIATFITGIFIINYIYNKYQSTTKDLIIIVIVIILWNPIITVPFGRELWIIFDIAGMIYFGYLSYMIK